MSLRDADPPIPADSHSPGRPAELHVVGETSAERRAASRPQLDERIELRQVAEILSRERVYRWLLALVDAVAAVAATYVASLFWFVGVEWPFALVPVYAVLIAKIQGLYDRDEMVLRKSTAAEWRALLQWSVLTSVGVYITWHTITDSAKYRHLTFFAFIAGTMFVLAAAGRSLARWIAQGVTNPERCLIVGDSESSEDLGRRLSNLKGVELVGVVATDESDWSVSGVAEVVSSLGVHRIIVGPYASWREPNMLELIRSAKWLGIRVSLMPSVMTVVGASTAVDPLESIVLLGVPRFGLSRSSLILKRTLDLIFAVFWLIVLAPLWLLVGVAIRLDSSGPVLYRQTRVGRDGHHFLILKFRSMVDGADAMQADLAALNEAGSGFFKIADDPRMTRVGRLIRRIYLDEIPQLINVLRGEMSFVGPRPLALAEDELLTGFDRHRLRLTPGITGPWQLRGPMHAPLAEMVKLDYMYASNWSVWEDFDIILGTAVRVFHRRGH